MQNKLFFTAGPSQLYPTVKEHVQTALAEHIGSISHRSKQFEKLFSDTVISLKKLMNIPQEYHVFFLSSGTEAMERIIENCVEKESFHFINGSFAKRFFDVALDIGKHPKKIESELGKGFELSSLTPLEISNSELLCFTHNETSTGVMLPMDDIYAFKKTHPDKLIALDIVSSAPYPELNFSFLDCVFFSVQKMFGLPAGLGVIIISPHALEKALHLQKKGVSIGSYHNFPTLFSWSQKNQTLETPQVLHMYLLYKVIEDFLSIGIETIRKKTDEKAKLMYDFLGTHAHWSAFVKEKEFRSPTVIVAQIGKNAPQIKKYLGEKGMIVGSGYGKNKDMQLRIANFPAIDLADMKRLIQFCKRSRE